MSRFNLAAKILPVATAAILVPTLGLTACSVNDLNPASSVTHDASGGAADEIEVNFPGANRIKVTHSDDNPNNMSWYYVDRQSGEEFYCTAIASATSNRGKTPGQIITEPYCRDADSVD